MKAIRITAYGAAPIVEDIAMPVPGKGEVLVRIKAAALNPLDVKLQGGLMKPFFPLDFPYTPGTDLAGEIAGLGADVRGWSHGNKIAARTDPAAGGAFAEYAIIPAEYLARIPEKMTWEEAAGIPTAAGTAWQALFETAQLAEGQTVLIHAGAGGVGSFAIQFARKAGARIFATASGSGLEIARQLGADKAIDYRSEDFVRKLSDVDIVLDTIGGETQQRSFEVLRKGGSLIAATMPPDEALAKVHDVSAHFVFHASEGQRLQHILDGIHQDRLKVLTDRIMPLSAFNLAFEHQASGHARGKIILMPPYVNGKGSCGG